MVHSSYLFRWYRIARDAPQGRRSMTIAIKQPFEKLNDYSFSDFDCKMGISVSLLIGYRIYQES